MKNKEKIFYLQPNYFFPASCYWFIYCLCIDKSTKTIQIQKPSHLSFAASDRARANGPSLVKPGQYLGHAAM